MKTQEVNEMTLQQACDFAVLKIVEQGKQCNKVTDNVHGCAYSDGKGNHCAVGWLLDPENETLMESNFAIRKLSQFSINVPALIRKNMNVFEALQDFHDCNEKMDRWDALDHLGEFIDTSAPQYEQWVNMGEGVHDKDDY